jgi:regulatory LuxR family protein
MKKRKSRQPESRSVHLFAPPIPGRPPVCWIEGHAPGVIVELWSEDEEEPFERAGRGKVFRFGYPKKYVIYDREKPSIRFVVSLNDGENANELRIVRGRLEWDGMVKSKEELRNSVDLMDSFLRLELRGHPPGVSHHRRKPHELAVLSAEGYLALEKCGLTKKQIRVFGWWMQGMSQVDIARKLRTSAAAVNRLLTRAEKKIQKKNPDFSLAKFKRAPDEVGSGQRWNGWLMGKDESGKSYARDVGKEVERPPRVDRKA